MNIEILNNKKVWFGNDKETCAKIQKRLLSLGFIWVDGKKSVLYIDNMTSIHMNNGCLSYGTDDKYTFTNVVYTKRDVISIDEILTISDEEYLEKLKGSKIWVGNNIKQSEKLEKRLLKLGFRWNGLKKGQTIAKAGVNISSVKSYTLRNNLTMAYGTKIYTKFIIDMSDDFKEVKINGIEYD
jgi:Fe2+ transport system protein FeoA